MDTPIRILLVDDSPYFLDAAADYLRMDEAFEVSGTASDAQSALESAGRLHPDVILLDLNLGDRSGMELIPQLKRALPAVVVIVLTMMSDESYRAAALKAGAEAFISKARMMELLAATIHSLVLKGVKPPEIDLAKMTAAEGNQVLLRLAEQSSDLIYRYEFLPKPGFAYVSPSAAAVTGYTPEEHYADPALGLKIIHPDDRPILEAVLQGKTKPGQPVSLRWVRKDGAVIWTEQLNIYLFNEKGELAAIEGIARDITARKQAETALRESEARFETIFRANPAATAITRLDNHQIADINDAWEEIAGYTRAEMVGRTPYEVGLWVDPAQREQMIGEMREKGRSRVEVKIRCRSGEIKDMQMEARQVELMGEPYLLTMATDITEPKRAQEAAEKNQAILASLIESSDDPIFSLDRDLCYTSFNQAHARLMIERHAVEPRLGASFFAGIGDPARLQVMRENLLRALDGEKFTQTAVRIQDGPQDRFFEITFNPIRSKSGEVTGVSVFAHDLTETRKFMERNLIQTTALEAAANAVVITSRSGAIEWVNPAWCALTGYTAEEAAGQNPRILNSGRQDDSFYQTMWETILAGKTWRGEMVNRRKDRSLYDEEQTITPVRNAAGEITHFIGIKQNISNRRRAERLMEARLRLGSLSHQTGMGEFLQKTLDEAEALTESQIGFFCFVEQDQITLQACSTNTLKRFGRPASAGLREVIERPEFWGDAFRSRRARIYNDCAALPGCGELPGGFGPAERFAVVPVVREGGVAALMGVGDRPTKYNERDADTLQQLVDDAWEIILRKRAENEVLMLNASLERRVAERTAELSRVNSELERALHVKDEFLASMSHELRTPLTGILGMSEALQFETYGPINERQRKSVNLIHASGTHLLNLINDILDLSKIGAGKMELRLEPVSAADACQASFHLVKGMAHQKRQKVILGGVPDSLRVDADARRLKQMLVNLLSNAVKFTPEGGRIGLDVETDPERQQIRFIVWDEGIGISSEGMASLFKPFVQLDTTLSRYPGSGLGLSLVKQMAELHGGSVEVESVVGQGSRFTLTLPWHQTGAGAPSAPAAAAETQQLEKPAQGQARGTILMVEDSLSVVETIRDYLQYVGYEVYTAHDGREAIERAGRIRPDLILMNVQMPNMDGLEATRILRGMAGFKTVPIIALTARAMYSDRERCLEAGMNEYLTKPVDLRRLAQVIAGFIERGAGSPGRGRGESNG